MMVMLKKWSDVLTIVSGKNQKAVEDSNGPYPIYGSGGIIGYASSYICDAGTTIIGRKGTINSPIFVNEPFWNVDTAFGISPGNELHPKYLYYYCCFFNFKELDKSTTIPSLAKRDLLQIQMPVPSLSEQDRIVSKIEELFSKLDASVAELQTAKEKLKVYRQAVLEESIPYDSFGAISQYIESMGQGWSPKCANKNSIDDDVWAVIKTTAVQHGYFDYTENKILPYNLEPRNQHEISVGDILITRAGPRSRCGVCCLVRKTKQRLLNCDKVYQIKPNRDKILPEYMEYVLNSPRFLLEINHCKTGGNDSGVNLTQSRFLTIKIPVPSLYIQKKIVEQIESRLSMCDSIEQTVDTSLQQAEAVRQSILKQAFEGKI